LLLLLLLAAIRDSFTGYTDDDLTGDGRRATGDGQGSIVFPFVSVG
jgi:hypothetical protein